MKSVKPSGLLNPNRQCDPLAPIGQQIAYLVPARTTAMRSATAKVLYHVDNDVNPG